MGPRIEATHRQIDWLVYELCGLTDDEVRIVEEAIALSDDLDSRFECFVWSKPFGI